MTTMARDLLRAVTERPVSAEWHRLANAFAEVDELHGQSCESAAFRRWQREATRALELAFGAASRHLAAFAAVEFESHEAALTSFGRSDREAVERRVRERYEHGLEKARGVLRAAMVEAGALDAARLDAVRVSGGPRVKGATRVTTQTVTADADGAGAERVKIEHRLRKHDDDPMNDYEEWKSGVPT